MSTIFECIYILSLFTLNCALRGYDMVFTPSEYLAPRALLTTSQGEFVQELATDEFSFCLYAYIENHPRLSDVDILSYSSKRAGEYNEIVLESEYEEGITSLYINGKGRAFRVLPPLDKWIHLCITWTSKNGRAQLYFDGILKGTIGGLKKGYTIGKDGYFILGQDQDYYNEGFQPEDGVRGRITQFQMWDRVLTLREVTLAHSCALEGNLVKWSSSTWGYFDAIQLQLTTAPCGSFVCKPPRLDGKESPSVSLEVTTPSERVQKTTIKSEPLQEVTPVTESIQEASTETGPNFGTTAETTEPSAEITTKSESSCKPLEHSEDSPLDNIEFESGSEIVTFVAQFLSTIRIPEFADLSLCAWIYVDLDNLDKTASNFLIRPTKNGETAFRVLFMPGGKVSVFLGGKTAAVTNWQLRLGWQHVCVTWSSSTGDGLRVYADGLSVYNQSDVGKGYTFPKEGWFYLLQTQWEPTTETDPTNGVVMKASDYNVWNRVLTKEEVSDVFCRGDLKGNIINWSTAKWKNLPYKLPKPM